MKSPRISNGLRWIAELAIPTAALVIAGSFLLGLPRAGSAPLGNGDANGDEIIDVTDISYLLHFMFEGGPAPTQILPCSPNVPVGTVIHWLPESPTAPLPADFVLCDGSLIADPASPFDGTATPDLIGRFIQGNFFSDFSVFGAATHGHQHSHSVELVGGATFLAHAPHSHTWATFNAATLAWVSGDGQALIDYANGIDSSGSGWFPISMFNSPPSATFQTDTRTMPPHFAFSNLSPSTTDAVSNNPRHVHLVPLMRIK